MTWTYDATLLAESEKDQIRLRISDTNVDDQVLADEEITYFINLYPQDFNKALLDCVKAAINRVSSLPEYTLGPYSESHTERIKQWEKMQHVLEKEKEGLNSPMSQDPTTAPIFSYDCMSVACCIREEGDPI